MASSLAGGHTTPRMQAPVLSVQRDPAWNSATRRVREVSKPAGPGKRRPSLDDLVVVVCFLMLIAIGVLGGVVMLLSWVAATLPVSPRIACPELDGCVVAGPEENDGVLVDDHRTDEPMLTR
jgi:hypothetical protein